MVSTDSLSARLYTCGQFCRLFLLASPDPEVPDVLIHRQQWQMRATFLSQNGIPFLLQSLTLGVSYGLRID